MLTEKELSTINNKAAKAFLAEAYQDYRKESSGIKTNGLNAMEVFLYSFALGTYELGATDNYLNECEVQAIYSRLRELSNA